MCGHARQPRQIPSVSIPTVKTTMRLLLPLCVLRRVLWGPLHQGVGAVTAADLQLAEVTGAAVCAFSVGLSAGLDADVRQKALRVLEHKIIYRLLDDVGQLLTEVAPTRAEEVALGTADILARFEVKARKNNVTVAGCRVRDGRYALLSF